MLGKAVIKNESTGSGVLDLVVSWAVRYRRDNGTDSPFGVEGTTVSISAFLIFHS